MEDATLAFGDLLCETGEAVRYVFFPNNSLISRVRVVEEVA